MQEADKKMTWRTVTNWHLTKSLAEDNAKDFRKRYPHDKFRIVADKRKRIGQAGRYNVQVWDTSIPTMPKRINR